MAEVKVQAHAASLEVGKQSCCGEGQGLWAIPGLETPEVRSHQSTLVRQHSHLPRATGSPGRQWWFSGRRGEKPSS